MAAASARALPLPRSRDWPRSPDSLSRRLLPSRRLLLLPHARPLRPILCCIADDFVSTRRSGALGRREFQALASLLRRVEPLDTSHIARGVSAAAKDSMKRTISAMLGLLPSDQFDVRISVSRRPLRHLLASSIITGYTLWNAEYRVSLLRNFESSPGTTELAAAPSECETPGKEKEGWGEKVEAKGGSSGMEVLGNVSRLSPAAMDYMQELELELATAVKELDIQKKEHMYLEHNREDNNDLLNYLRSLEPDMVAELSRSSSSEVDEIIQQLAQNIHMRLFEDEDYSSIQKTAPFPKKEFDQCDDIDTTRDYLAKLLFWCMLMGHHLRGLEYRLHLSCVVGLL